MARSSLLSYATLLLALAMIVEFSQTWSGMDVGFGVSAAAMAMELISLIGGMVFYRNKPHGIYLPQLQDNFQKETSLPIKNCIGRRRQAKVGTLEQNRRHKLHVQKVSWVSKGRKTVG